MGYARLHFANSGTLAIEAVLHDIVGVVTGNFTQTSQLTVATRDLSEIVNTLNSNWDILFPTPFSYSTANDAFILQAPCLENSAKRKYVRFTHKQADSTVAATGGTGGFNRAMGSNQSGILLQSITSATSAFSVSNETWYNTNNSSPGTQTLYTGPNIYLSWSQRHLLISSPVAQTGPQGFTAVFEFNEVNFTRFRGTAPQIHIQHNSNNSNWVNSGAPTSDNSLRSVAFIMNHYNPSNTVATNLYSIIGNLQTANNDHPLIAEGSSVSATAVLAYPQYVTKNSSGSFARPVQPLWIHQHQIGIPHMFVSHLSNVYRTAPNMGSLGDLVTIGNDTYVLIPAGRDSTFYSLLVRRA